MAYTSSWVTIVRVVQAIFAVIVLGLTAYVINWDDYYSWWSPSTVNFMLFNSVWTLVIALPYIVLAPVFFAGIVHPFIVVGMEAVTMIFWFAGFIALACVLPPPRACHSSLCDSLQAATVFGAFEWALFAATTTINVMAVFTSRGNNGVKANPNAAVHTGV
ncbi:hypothetical protein ASPZODRAFT_634619 [Penicilliopsis zonata CBS 506.65]|uniref:MARVEL domain-containing protein n=1 Tax=Penicilliopsis zonata CBS 506.65 TaxID=1073090 RepID=A0A1L9SCB9_9EURO|nr:hypothetical protein ASPZODRAFT_634619 [Penicilliopsis zonata CBS 506.65]OJJ44860.1 hypothetical protein ASPZODRAFT_634619 [Penicilliopsis zonata CBS 506.65]